MPKAIVMPLFALASCSTLVVADERPNIVFILADDLGLGDVSFYARNIQQKEPQFETPTIDALASQGLWFTDGHSATALCAPTRYAVMSGNNNYRSYAPAGVWSTFAPTAFPPGEVTLGTVVRDAGYSTGFIGKWHMGGDFYVPGTKEIYRGPKAGDLTGKVDVTRWIDGGPKYCGFDYDFTTPCGIQGPMYLFYENGQWCPWAHDSEIVFFNEQNAKNPKDVSDKGPGPGDSNWDTREVGKILSAKAMDFIEASAKKDEPFFLYYCSPIVHLPHCPTDEFDGRKIKGSTVSPHLDMTADLDMQVKRIVDALKATHAFQNTLIVFSSDNGGLKDGKATREIGYQPGGEWNGSKNSPLEGGHRVPTFAVWPGHIEPGITDQLVINQDMVATFAALVGTDIPAGQAQDSNNLLPLLTGKGKFQPRDYWVNQAGSGQELMLRNMPWKLVIQSNFKRTTFEPKSLFNLTSDPQENRNLLKNPESTERVRQMLALYMDIVQSGRPTAPGLKLPTLAESITNADGMIDLISAPEERFDGRIFFINDWDGGDADNQNVAQELNRNSAIKQDVTVLSDFPDRKPRKVHVDDLVEDAKVLADASKKGKIGLAMGAHSRHVLAWLTKLPKDAYNYDNIVLVTHSNWNELDGRAGYEANKKLGDPPLEDSHGVDLRRGLYLSLSKISDLGVTILEIPRTDSGPGGWGGRVAKPNGQWAAIKAFDISDLGLVHYLKAGVIEATRLQRNQLVSDVLRKPETLDQVDRELITEHWEKNHAVPGQREDYLPGGKYCD